MIGNSCTLTHSQMGIDTRVTGGSGQILVLTVGDMEVGFGVTVLLGQAKINDIDLVPPLSDAHQEIVGLDVAMNERLGMNVLDAGDQLIGEQQHRFQRELAVAEIEKILQARTEQVEHHGIVITLGAKPTDEGNANASRERFVDTGLILELGMLGLDTLELDGDFFPRDDVGSCRAHLVIQQGTQVAASMLYLSKYHQNFHCQSSARFDTCCRHADPKGRANRQCGPCFDGGSTEEFVRAWQPRLTRNGMRLKEGNTCWSVASNMITPCRTDHITMT